MPQSAKRALISLLLLIGVSSAPPADSLNPKTQALQLVGKSSEYGAVKFQICQSGILIIDNLGTAIWRANDPSNIITVNPENKTYYLRPCLGGRLGDTVVPKNKILEPIEFIDKCVLAKQNCLHYRAYRKGHDGSKEPSIEFWALEKNPFPGLLTKTWCTLFLIPEKYGFPIQVTKIGPRQWHFFKLMTISDVPVEKVDLKLPTGLKRVKDKAALYFSQEGGGLQASDLDEFFRTP